MITEVKERPPAGSKAPAIDAAGITKRFGKQIAVDGLDLRVEKEEIFGLLGPNGAGKTTMISMLSSILQPDSGSISVLGNDMKTRAGAAKAQIGLVPQELSVYPTITARQNLEFFGGIYGLSGAALKSGIDQCLAMVGLTDRAGDKVDDYSGGMKRRLNIAAGIIHQPKMLFLDEPTVGVDPQSRNFIFEHVESLREQGMTIIYTTHYMEEAERLCDRIGIMDEGKMIALGSSQELVGSLGGGLIRLDVGAEHAQAVKEDVRSLPSVRSVDDEDDVLQIHADEGTKALLDIARVLEGAGAGVRSLELLEPNLENVFLQLTGKELRDGGK